MKVGDNENLTEFKKQLEKEAEKLRSSTSDTRSIAMQIVSLAGFTDREEKPIKEAEADKEEARRNLEQRTEVQQRKKLKSAQNQWQKPRMKNTRKDMEKGKTANKDDMETERAGEDAALVGKN